MAETRTQSFEGEIKKCPHCGAVLPSMATKCPECGVELRNTGMSSSLQQFYQELKDGNDMQDVETISNFPVPNNKEDFLDFLVMAKGEIEKDYDPAQDVERQKHEAWVSKYSQCKAKAPLLFANDEKTLTAINKIFNETKTKKKSFYSKLSKDGKKTLIALTGVIGWFILLGGIGFFCSGGLNTIKNALSSATSGNLAKIEQQFTVPKDNVTLPGGMASYFALDSDVEFKITGKKEVTFVFSLKCTNDLDKALAEKVKESGLSMSRGEGEVKAFCPLSPIFAGSDDGSSHKVKNSSDAVFGIPVGESKKIICTAKVSKNDDVKVVARAAELGTFAFGYFEYSLYFSRASRRVGL